MEPIDIDETIKNYENVINKHRDAIRFLKAELAWSNEKLITYKKYGDFYRTSEFKTFAQIAISFLIVIGIIAIWPL